MVHALVSAKTQTVKEIKKNSKRKKINKLILKLIIIFIIIFLIALVLNKIIIETRYSFTDKETGIEFISEGFHIKEGFRIFSQDENYLVVFNYNPVDQNYLSSITDGIVYIQSMLSAKNKNTILLISVIDENNNLIYCQSNQGDLYENKELTSEECLTLIQSDLSTIIVDYPSKEYTTSKVILNLSEKLLFIKPKSNKDVYPSLNISINQMFPDAVLIEDSLGDVSKKISDLNISN
jgi:hypothetical protein